MKFKHGTKYEQHSVNHKSFHFVTLSEGTESATCLVIYLEKDDSMVTVLSTTVFIPGACK